LALCKTFGLSGYSKKTKPLLILAIESHLQKKSVDSCKADQPKKFKLSPSKSKGAKCSVKGKEYELKIHDIVKRCEINGVDFNTQTPSKLGGTGPANDIECNLREEGDIAIEIKKCKAPDWMQCSLKYDDQSQRWKTNSTSKIPEKSKQIFESLLYFIQDTKNNSNSVQIFNNKIPPFMNQNITHQEWLKIKSETCDFNDIYVTIDSNTIKNLYREKNCQYIQISEKGLYHLGNDICQFNIPEFNCPQELRIRTKIHSRSNTKGYCNLSVMMSCKPKNIKNLEKSEHSLDSINRLPLNLLYDGNL
jgi:hypothetical protein